MISLLNKLASLSAAVRLVGVVLDASRRYIDYLRRTL